jgi:transposase
MDAPTYTGPHSRVAAKALDYSLRRWVALTRFVDDGQLPVDNNWIENQIRPIAIVTCPPPAVPV